MSDIKELKDEELEKVSGGGSGTYDGITYKDGDVYVSKEANLTSAIDNVYVLKNCGATTCDIDYYMYNKNTKEFIYISPLYTAQGYYHIACNYVKYGITFNK